MDTARHTARLDRLDRIARQMDRVFRIPGTGIRLGYDSILGLIPGIGDAVAVTPSAFIVLESHRMGLPKHLVGRQVVNILVDMGIGTIPLLGDLFDVGYKANMRNVKLLREHLDLPADPADRTGAGTEAEGRLSSHHPSRR